MNLGGDLSEKPLRASELWQTAKLLVGSIRSELEVD